LVSGIFGLRFGLYEEKDMWIYKKFWKKWWFTTPTRRRHPCGSPATAPEFEGCSEKTAEKLAGHHLVLERS